MTILLIEQNANQALKLSEYSYILENGRIALEGKSTVHQGAHRHERRGFAARTPQSRRRRADRLAVLHPAGSEGRQGAPHRARSHPRHPEELGLSAKTQDGGPELGSRYRSRNTARLRSKADATRVSTGAV